METVNSSGYAPVLELTRGDVVESIHRGAIVVVDVSGNILAWYGDPNTKTYLRSAAKPFQILPFLERGGMDEFGITQRELALMCASHSGTDDHVAALKVIQEKTGVNESELLCGVHDPFHLPTRDALRMRGEKPTPNRHNCSGKHTGMLAFLRLKERRGDPIPDGLTYIDPIHPIQREIVSTFAQMCQAPLEQVSVGIDGCSAPNFALPLRYAALAFARLADPVSGGVQPSGRAAACSTVVSAMTSHPDMVGGPERFDTRLMEVSRGRILMKAGAEGYQGVSLLPGALGPGSQAMGIALKIADGDRRKSVRSAVVLEVLRQLEALSEDELDALAEYGPSFPIHNWRKIVVGEARPVVVLNQTGRIC